MEQLTPQEMESIEITKTSPDDYVIAFAGNPNVGKSSIFNVLTGMRQHTGNWPGKTVEIAQGNARYGDRNFVLVDLPGTYSLLAHSSEEEVARDFIVSEEADATVVVCDATALERNLNLVLQIMQLTPKVVVCVNLLDEAKRKHIDVNLEKLQEQLGVPVVGTSATHKKGMKELMAALQSVASGKVSANPYMIKNLQQMLHDNEEKQVEAIMDRASAIASTVVHYKNENYDAFDRRLDKIFTNKWTGYPVMILLLMLVFWFTIEGANVPSEMLGKWLFSFQDWLMATALAIGVPKIICDILIGGVLHVVSWVVSVMLPPMAIFFPLFTLLEDFGYLPRIAFNLDHQFQKAGACGKQALSMCMGFGCNAAGVTGARIIDSPRERLIAIITNNFVPCNGRFPILIGIITTFFVGGAATFSNSLRSAFFLTGVICLGVFMTFIMSNVLSKTVLKGMPSSFTLELPPYRKPRVGQVIIRSVFDRTIFVLGRAIVIAAPAGLVIWCAANLHIGGDTILHIVTSFLDPFARLMGIDGVILMAFILAFPANEIFIPCMLMGYLASNNLVEYSSLLSLKSLLVDNGWTWLTAACTILFTLYHWPCGTTMLTIYKETKSMKWTLTSFLVPTITGIVITMALTLIAHLFHLV